MPTIILDILDIAGTNNELSLQIVNQNENIVTCYFFSLKISISLDELGQA